MSKYTFNVNKYCIEKDDRFFAYVNVVGANRIVKFLNEQEKRMQFLKEELKDYSDDNARLEERILELKRHIERNTISRITVEDVLGCARDSRFCDNEEVVKAIDCIAKDLGVNLY